MIVNKKLRLREVDVRRWKLCHSLHASFYNNAWLTFSKWVFRNCSKIFFFQHLVTNHERTSNFFLLSSLIGWDCRYVKLSYDTTLFGQCYFMFRYWLGLESRNCIKARSGVNICYLTAFSPLLPCVSPSLLDRGHVQSHMFPLYTTIEHCKLCSSPIRFWGKHMTPQMRILQRIDQRNVELINRATISSKPCNPYSNYNYKSDYLSPLPLSDQLQTLSTVKMYADTLEVGTCFTDTETV